MDLMRVTEYAGLTRDAALSPCGKYRWWLKRSWRNGGNGKTICFVMLNPSTADANIDDPTIRRCMGFARIFGFSVLEVRNLFSLRATNPKELLSAADPYGEHGNECIHQARTAHVVVAAWGAKVPFQRDKQAQGLLEGIPLWCLGVTKEGHPRHPLYVRNDTALVRWPIMPSVNCNKKE